MQGTDEVVAQSAVTRCDCQLWYSTTAIWTVFPPPIRLRPEECSSALAQSHLPDRPSFVNHDRLPPRSRYRNCCAAYIHPTDNLCHDNRRSVYNTRSTVPATMAHTLPDSWTGRLSHHRCCNPVCRTSRSERNGTSNSRRTWIRGPVWQSGSSDPSRNFRILLKHWKNRPGFAVHCSSVLRAVVLAPDGYRPQPQRHASVATPDEQPPQHVSLE